MKNVLTILLLSALTLTVTDVGASHSMGLDLTYQCLGGDTFAVTMTFYRDCAGINAPGQGSEPLPVINITSDSCGITLTKTLAFVSMQELAAVCASLITTCSGGSYPGVEEYVYSDTVVLPDTCDDWTFSYALCCRNNAITTISPKNVNIYVETNLDYANTPCNNSPVFTNTPVPFMCVNSTFCFNNGAVDPDGDSLVYSLITPTTGDLAGDTVNYVAGYGPYNPVTSSPPMSFNPLTGDICLTPTVIGEVSVMQVRVEEWRNGVKIGYIDRDIQLRVVDCVVPNTLPFVDGINGTGVFTASVCAGDSFCFFTNSLDPDTSQTITMSWNSGISNASFGISGGPRPVGNFCWQPDSADISGTPHCFTVEVTDDNCPFLGTQTFSFCITVFGYINTSVLGVQDANCPGSCDGQADVGVNGGVPPYTYLWDDPGAQTSALAVGLCAGTYTVQVTDSVGCTPTRSVTVTDPQPILLQLDSTGATCNGMSDATATVTASGGTGAYTYLWDANAGSQTTPTASGLSAGTYAVTVTDDNGCDTAGTITITDPAILSADISDSTMLSCFGGSDGTASVTPSGGIPLYSYQWDLNAGSQTDSTATGLSAGTFSVTVTDSNGCPAIQFVTINEPPPISTIISDSSMVSCKGGSDGSATAQAIGGTPPYTFLWDPATGSQTDSTALNLSAGIFNVTITDVNACTNTESVLITEPPLLLVPITDSINISCNGGSDGYATVTPTGGTLPYSFIWDLSTGSQTNATANGLAAGTYAVTVTDNNGCDTNTSVSLTEPALLTLTTTVTGVLCNGGADGIATVSSSGGTAPYSYLWSDSGAQTDSTASGLMAGSFVVTVTDSKGCDTSASVIIAEPAVVSATITDSANISCSSGNDGTATVTPAGGIPPYYYLWDINAGSQTDSSATGLSAGTYTVTVTDSNNCVATETVNLTEPEPLTSLMSDSVMVSCNGGNDGTATVQAGGGSPPYSFLWDPAAGSQTDSTAINLMAGTFSVTVTDGNGCSITDSVIITEPLLLSSSITDSLNITCNSGNDGFATVTPFGGTGPFSYQWSDPGAQTDSSATGLYAGTYFVTVTDDKGCSETGSVTLTEPAAALALTYAIVNVSCTGGNDGSASVFVTGGTPPYSYQWDDPDLQTDSIATGLYAGSYTITVTDNTGNCQVDTGILVTEPASPLTVTTATSDVSCNGGSNGTASVTVTGGTSPYTYSWSDPGAQTTMTASGLIAGTYDVTVVDNTGNCMIDTGIVVNEPLALNASVTVTHVACFGDSSGTAFATASGGVLPYSFLWNDPAAQTDSIAVGLAAGTYSVTLTDSNSCAFMDTAVTVTQPAAPLSVIMTAVNVSCNGDKTGSASATVSGGTEPYTYAWNDESFQTGQTASGLGAGIYSVTVTDSNNCTISAPVIITQPALPLIVSVSATDVPCYGSSVGTASASVSGGSAPYTYQWDVLAGSQTNATATGLSAGNYSVQVTDSFGCIVTDSSATVDQPPQIIWDSLNVVADGICIGDSTQVSAIYPIGDPSFTYSWDNGLGTGLGPFWVGPLVTTTYTITVADACGNDTSRSGTVVVNPLPQVVMDSLIISGCMPLVVEFENAAQGPDDSLYVWDFGDGQTSTEFMPEHTYPGSGTYEVTLNVTSGKACSFTSGGDNYVVVYPLPEVTCSADPYETDSRYPTINFFGGIDGLLYTWNFGDSLASIEQSPLHYFDTIGTYHVTLSGTDEHTCENTCELDITINPYYDVVVPNAFTPNPNGPAGGYYDPFSYDNDVFFPSIDYVDRVHMMIFNRWGELVFETFDLRIGWDGYYRGKLSQQDTYAWRINVIFVDGVAIERLGEVTLIR